MREEEEKSKRLSVVLLEDDKAYCNLIEEDMVELAQFQLEKIINDGISGLGHLLTKQYDVVILDIKLPFISGMEIIEYLEEMGIKIPYLIFITGLKDKALEAFKYQPVEFLVKPYSFTRFKRAMKKIYEAIHKREDVPIQAYGFSRGLVYKDEYGYKIIPFKKIKYLLNVEGTVHVYSTEGEKITIKKLLKTVEQDLPPFDFVRTHRNCIVNVKYIDSLKISSKGKEHHLFLKDEEKTKIEVGRKYWNFLKKGLGI